MQLQTIMTALGYPPNRPFDVATAQADILGLVWDRQLRALRHPLAPIDRSRWLNDAFNFSDEHILGPLNASRNFDALGGARVVALAHLIGYIESGGAAGLGTDEAMSLAIVNAGHVYPALNVTSPPSPV